MLGFYMLCTNNNNNKKKIRNYRRKCYIAKSKKQAIIQHVQFELNYVIKKMREEIGRVSVYALEF